MTIDELLKKLSEIKINTSGYWKNINFDNDLEAMQVKQMKASTKSGTLEEYNALSVVAINGGDSVISTSANRLPPEILLRIPHHALENSDILPEFIDFMAIWDKLPTYI